jgi:hypothetical protein
MFPTMRRTAAIVLLTLGLALPVAAQTAVGTFEDWTAVTDERTGTKVCYAVSRPIRSEPQNVKRGDIWALVTQRPAAKARDEVRFVQGYPLVEKGQVKVTIGSDSFLLFTAGEDAWAPSATVDGELVAAMRKGATMTVEGTSTRGTKTVDTYSLTGFTAALGAATKACDG